MSEDQKVTRVMQDSSIEISKNSRGFTYSVKAYGQTDQEITDKIKSLKQKAEDIIKQEEVVQ